MSDTPRSQAIMFEPTGEEELRAERGAGAEAEEGRGGKGRGEDSHAREPQSRSAQSRNTQSRSMDSRAREPQKGGGGSHSSRAMRS